MPIGTRRTRKLSGTDVVREMIPGEGRRGRDQVGRRAFENHPAAVVASARTQIDDPVGIGQMQARGGFVKDEHSACGAHVDGQAQIAQADV